MTCLLPTPSSMGRASLHVRPCIQISRPGYHRKEGKARNQTERQRFQQLELVVLVWLRLPNDICKKFRMKRKRYLGWTESIKEVAFLHFVCASFSFSHASFLFVGQQPTTTQ